MGRFGQPAAPLDVPPPEQIILTSFTGHSAAMPDGPFFLWSPIGKGANVNEVLSGPNNHGWTGEGTCKSAEQEEDCERDPRWLWAGNQMENPGSNPDRYICDHNNLVLQAATQGLATLANNKHYESNS